MKKVIMLIDDEVDFCYFLQKNLEATGEFEVLTSNSGPDGLKKIKQRRPDLILLDVMMPKVSGSDVAAELRNDGSTRDIPVIFLTAIVQEQEIKPQQNTIGGWHYMAKPVKLNELISTIKELTQ
jgi:CheY-like chemotaxis protein